MELDLDKQIGQVLENNLNSKLTIELANGLHLSIMHLIKKAQEQAENERHSNAT